jgi:WD40 repeat protein
VYDLAFSADGSLLVSASGDGDVRVWDTRPEEERLRARAARQELRTEALRRLDVPQGDLASRLRALEEAHGLAPDERAAAREALWLQGSKP